MAGGRGTKAADIVMKAVFQEIGLSKPGIAYVGAASGDDTNFFGFIGEMIKRGGDCALTQVFLCDQKADIKKARDILQKSDAIFMSGGDVEAGMQVLQQKQLEPFFKELYFKGTLFFGASAGSIMLAGEWVRWRDPDDDSSAELFPCLGIAPVLCDTHAEADKWEELKWALKLYKGEVTGYGIATNSCLKVYADNRIEALGGAVARFIKQGEKIIKEKDLLPFETKNSKLEI